MERETKGTRDVGRWKGKEICMSVCLYVFMYLRIYVLTYLCINVLMY